METVMMGIVVVVDGSKILLRKTDPAKNPYDEPWALFGGRIGADRSVEESMNDEFMARWNFSVKITEKLYWDEDYKKDHDGIDKKFIYLDALCELKEGVPNPVNPAEEIKWVEIAELDTYEFNPPSKDLLTRLGYIS